VTGVISDELAAVLAAEVIEACEGDPVLAEALVRRTNAFGEIPGDERV